MTPLQNEVGLRAIEPLYGYSAAITAEVQEGMTKEGG
jgi:hypothetical protein